jgi:hypothetical protein
VIFASLAVSNEGASRVEPLPEGDLAIVDEEEDQAIVDEDEDQAIVDEDEDQASSTPVKLYTKGQETRFLLATKKRVPNYDFLPKNQKVSELQTTIKLAMAILADKGVEKALKSGDLPTVENEAMEQTRLRYKELRHRRWLTKSYHAESELSTCCDCGQVFNKKFQDKRQIKVTGHASRCRGGKQTLTLGWSLVKGDWSSDFPENNIFNLFLSTTLRPNTGYNMFQISAALVTFIRENEDHPQSKELSAEYHRVFGAMESFQRGTGARQGHEKGAWTQSLERALDKLKDVYSMVVLTRASFPRERSHFGTKTTEVKCRVFSPIEGETSFVEDLEYLGYNLAIRLPPRTEPLVLELPNPQTEPLAPESSNPHTEPLALELSNLKRKRE